MIKKALITQLILIATHLVSFAIFGSATGADVAQLIKLIQETKNHIAETRKVVRATNEVAKIMQNPKEAIKSINDLGDGIKELDAILNNQNTNDLKKLHESINDLSNEYDRLQKVTSSTGKKTNRKYKLHEVYKKVNNLYNDYDEILNADKKIQTRERKRQQQLYDRLNFPGGVTPEEREQILLAIEASKGVQESSTNELIKVAKKIQQEYTAKKIQDDLEADEQWEVFKENSKIEDRINKEYDAEEIKNLEKLFFEEKKFNRNLNIL